MKKITFCIVWLLWICCHIQISAQIKGSQIREDGAYMYADQMPEYSAGQTALMQYLAKSIKYPVIAHQNGISGRVLVQFVVEKNGKLSAFKVIKGVEPLLDAEALRVVKSIPGEWIPGKEKGKEVSVVYNIPISFRLPGNIFNDWVHSIRKPSVKVKGTLQGVWQLCNKVTSTGQDKYAIQTDPYLKVLSSDMKFINMYVGIVNNKSAINTIGIYKQTSDSTYVESVYRSSTEPISFGEDRKLGFEFLTENLLMVKYRKPGSSQDTIEVWTRVEQPRTDLYSVFSVSFISKSESDEPIYEYQKVDKMPEFPEGQSALMSYIGKNLKYPYPTGSEQARVLIKFVVEKDGTLSNVHVVKSVYDILMDNEALRVVKSMPKWSPGYKDGKPVRVYFTIPVMYRLQ